VHSGVLLFGLRLSLQGKVQVRSKAAEIDALLIRPLEDLSSILSADLEIHQARGA